MNKLRLFSICAYAAIIPYEQNVISFLGITYGKLFGGLVILLLLPYIFKQKAPAKIIVPLLLFVMFLGGITYYFSNSGDDVVNSMFQNFIIFISISGFVSRDISRANAIIFTLISSLTLISILAYLGIGVSDVSDRMKFADMGINSTANYAAISIVAALYFIVRTKKFVKYLLLASIIPNVSLLGNSGSKGALLALLIGILCLYVFKKGAMRVKVKNTIIGVFVVGAAAVALYNVPVMRARIMFFQERGDESRMEVWAPAYEIFEENLLTGVGVIEYRTQIENRIGHFKDTHNTYLYVLVSTGIIGGILFLFFLINFIKVVFKGSLYVDNVFSIALMFMVLLNWTKGGGSLYSKSTWLFLSYCLGVGLYGIIHSKYAKNK